MPPPLRVVNLKHDLPSVEEARQRLYRFLDEARSEGLPHFKLVHGYGSTGTGGRIRHGLAKSLARLKKEGRIARFVPGERWKKADPETRQVLASYPALAKDADLGRGNQGITIVVVGSKARPAARRSGPFKPSPAKPRSAPRATPDVLSRDTSDLERLYDAYSQPHMIRRMKEDL